MNRSTKLHIADFTDCVTVGVAGTNHTMRGWRNPRTIDDKCCHHLPSPLSNPRMVVNDKTIVAHDAQVLQMSVEDILECVNEGHSDEWLDYDETDFVEGMYEWTYLFLTDKAVYELLGIRPPDAPKRLIDIYG